MKKAFTWLLLGSTFAFAACSGESKQEENKHSDTTAVQMTPEPIDTIMSAPGDTTHAVDSTFAR